jgi:MFS-type transporter involved in bile tolerance (Atg22 family)
MVSCFLQHGIGRGPIYMAAIFLSTALIYLAADEVGCVEFNEETEKDEIIEDCNIRVYGAFSPAALVTNIATISGVLVALLLPIAGAIIDFTPHRRTVGIVSAVLMILTDFAQIFTNSKNWFAMAILEAISGLFFEVQLVCTLAYLPEIAKEVGTTTMNTSEFCSIASRQFLGFFSYPHITMYDTGSHGTHSRDGNRIPGTFHAFGGCH